MTSRALAATLVAGCLTAAAGGAYVAVRHNQAPATTATAAVAAAPATTPSAAPAALPPEAVSETEAVVETPGPVAPRPRVAEPAPPRRTTAPAQRPVPRRATPPEPTRAAGNARPPAAAPLPEPAVQTRTANPPAVERRGADTPITAPPIEADVVRAAEPAQRVRQFDELVVPASSVLGLRVDTPLSSERSRLEDRVDARVSRDVTVDGRVAIPSGSRVIGSVAVVDRGGKMKERARLGVRFHTLVLADGREVPLRTETVMREGDSPSSESARKIGGAAIGGAILGAIMGGGKGAVLGGATGAAGGSAVVMAGDRNAATLPAGTVVSVRLSSPTSIEVEHPQQ